MGGRVLDRERGATETAETIIVLGDDGRYDELCRFDGRPIEHCYGGTYAVDETTLVVTEDPPFDDCVYEFGYELHGDVLTLTVLDAGCEDVDDPEEREFIEMIVTMSHITAPFTLVDDDADDDAEA